MYTHSMNCLSVVYHVPLFIRCYKTKMAPWCKHFACEALLCATSAISIVTIEVALVVLKSKLEVKMSAIKLPSCVTVKT